MYQMPLKPNKVRRSGDNPDYWAIFWGISPKELEEIVSRIGSKRFADIYNYIQGRKHAA